MAKAKGIAGRSHLLGSWSFLIGLILAVLLGLGYVGAYRNPLVWLVFLLGVVVGLLNITHDEMVPFMTAGVVLALVSFLGASVLDGLGSEVVSGILKGVLTLFVPATMIVALKSVFVLARG